jgi:hypothetical protein
MAGILYINNQNITFCVNNCNCCHLITMPVYQCLVRLTHVVLQIPPFLCVWGYYNFDIRVR